MMKIMVSACLLGENCKYNGGNNRHTELIQALSGHTVIPVCPEVLGGLPTPRTPAEIQGERVVTRDGRDVTKEYQKGAEEAARLYQLLRCDCAILKARSTSCGCGQVYDGAFSGTLTPGDGIAAQALKRINARVITEERIKGL